MFLFLPIILIILLIQLALKNGVELGGQYTNTILGVTYVFGIAPYLVISLAYGSHFLISRWQRLSEGLLKIIALTPYVVFAILIAPQFMEPHNGSWLLTVIYAITGNLKWLQDFLLDDYFFGSLLSNDFVAGIISILTISQYYLIFGLYLKLYYWFNLKGSRDYRTPILVEFISSNRLFYLGFVLIAFFEVFGSLSSWQNLLVAESFSKTSNEFYHFILVSSEVLVPLIFPFLMLLLFPLILPKMAGWKILPEGPELSLLKKTAKDNKFKYHKIYLANNQGLVTAGVIGIFSRTTNLLFTKDILKLLNEKELEAVMLHEIGHAKYLHIIFYILFLSTLGAFSIIMISLFFVLLPEFEDNSWFFELMVLVLSIRFGWGWLSRQCERQADLNAAEVQGTPEYIVSSFYKISASGHSLDKPSWHHGSLRERINNLTTAFGVEGLALRNAFHRKIKIIKILILSFLILTNGFFFFFNYYKSSNRGLVEINNKLNLATAYLFKKEYPISEKYYFEIITTLHNPELSLDLKKIKNKILLITYYNLSCLYSLSGKLEKAMIALRETLPLFDKEVMSSKSRYEALNVHKLETDPDLAALRTQDSYFKFIEEVKIIEKGFGLQT